MASQRWGKECRCQRAHDAVEPGRTRAERDETEHVQVAALHRGHRAGEEWPPRPKHHRRAQQQLYPVRGLLGDEAVKVDQMPTHLQREHGQGQRQAHPEAPGHVPEFRAFTLFGCGQYRLQGHAAEGAVARPHLPYLRVHRAGVFDLAQVTLGHRSDSGRVMVGMPGMVVTCGGVRVVAVRTLHHRAIRHHMRSGVCVVLGSVALCMFVTCVTCVTAMADMGLMVMARRRSVAVRQRLLCSGVGVFMPSVGVVSCVR